MNYCLDKDKLNHPGFVVIDSPLTTFKKNKKKKNNLNINQDLDIEIHQLFYNSLSKYKDSQVIIIENNDKTPSDTLDINIIDLDKTNGLFPIK